MKILSDLADFLKQHRIYQGKSVPSRAWTRGNTDVFFDKLAGKEFKNDNDAAYFFFGKKDYNYSELKSNLLDYMVTSVLMVDFSNQRIHPYYRKYYSMIRELAVAKIMMGKTFGNVAIFFAKRCYSKADELGFFDLQYEAAWILKYYNGIMLKKESEFVKYSKKLNEAMGVLQLENRAITYLGEALILSKGDRANLKKCHEFAKDRFEELSIHLVTCPSLRFQMFARLIRNIAHSSISDFVSMMNDSDDDIQYFTSKFQGYTTTLFVFLYQKTIACVRLGRYKEGLETINQSLSYLEDDNVNWYSAQYHKFYILMQSGSYSEAQELYLSVIRKKRYNSLVGAVKEDWIIGGAYLNYVIEKGLLKSEKQMKFKVGKFLNEVPEYSKDRRVKNIPILIAQILFMLHRRQTSKAIDRIDAIKQYCGRNLRYNEAVRSNSFIMALMEIPKCSFNRKAVSRKIGRYMKRLEEVPLHQSGKNFDLELIPYEKLLGYTLESL